MPTDPYLYPADFRGFRSRQPVTGPGGFGTYQVSAYWRRAACSEAECEAWAQGWSTAVDVTTQLGQEQADYIRYHSGRRFTEHPTLEGTITFRFPPGQTCFASSLHVVQAEREPLYLWRPGDHRGGYQRHEIKAYERADQWVDDFATETDTIQRARSRAGTGQ